MPLNQVPPAVWQALAKSAQITVRSEERLESRQVQVDPELTIEWKTQIYSPDTQRLEFKDGVKAFYGPTVLTCDSLTLDVKASTGTAIGNVVVTDPEGVIRADKLEFNWKNRSGSASNAHIELGSLRLLVQSVVIVQGAWKLDQVSVASLAGANPLFWLDAKSISIKPGENATIENSSFRIGKTKIVGFPTANLSLDRRIQSLSIPTINFRKGSGPGLSWETNRFLAPQTLLAGSIGIFPGFAPNYGLQLNQSLLPRKTPAGSLTPRSDLADRFTNSWMDSITARKPDQQWLYASANRQTLGIGTFWNQSTRGRLNDSEAISKRAELVGEFSGPTSLGGILAQVRFQSIRPIAESRFRQRAVTQLTWTPLAVPITRDTSLQFGADGFATLGDSAFSWIRSNAGLIYKANSNFTFGASSVFASSFGKPDFGFDDLYSKNAIHLRTDARLGAFRFGALSKYDWNRKRWYDHQFEIAVQIGVLEPYFIYRQFPNDIRVGLTLRLDSIVSRLQNRDIRRL